VKNLDLSNKRVLVTGASSGLGLEMARQLARDHKAHPILVARRRDRLADLAKELEQLGASPELIAADMTRADDRARVFAETTERAPLAAAILNAGVTFFGRAVEQGRESVDGLIATNVTAVVDLSLRYVSYFKQRGDGGGLLLVSSMASLQPMPYQATYGASKAFVTSFGQALAEEHAGDALSVTTFCPGGIATDMIESAGMSEKYNKDHPMVMAVEPCARLALGAFVRRERVYVPGALNKLTALSSKLAPMSLVTKLVARDYRDVLPKR